MHTETSIFELVIRDEDRDIWKTYLARQNWEQAKRAAKVSRDSAARRMPCDQLTLPE